MPTCFVIQPFDGGKFDKRFRDVFKPAIEAAGLEAYRVDQDPSADVPIESIEQRIRSSHVCLADVTLNNPNVWYELGFAFAAGRPTVMVCSSEREGGRLPFDIQHRAIVYYESESSSDFASLQERLTARLTAAIEKADTLADLADSQIVSSVEGLTPPELTVLAALAASVVAPDGCESLWSVRSDAEKAGTTAIGFQIGFRRLRSKGFVEVGEYQGGGHDDSGPGALITPLGWEWIDKNSTKFVTRKKQSTRSGYRARSANEAFPDDDIPF